MKVIIEPIRFGAMVSALIEETGINGAAIVPARLLSLLNANNTCSDIEHSARIPKIMPEHSRHPIQSRQIRP